MFKNYPILVFFLFFLSAPHLFAQIQETSKVRSDRPGGTVGPAKLDKGVLNLELGAKFSTFKPEDASGINAQNYAGFFRYGLLERLEVSLGFEYRRIEGQGGVEAITGLGPLYSGIKMAVADEKGAFPQIEFEATLIHSHFGKKAFRPEDTEPAFNFNFANNFSDRTAINYAIGMFWEGAEEGGYYGFMLRHYLTNNLMAYGETYGFVRGDFNGEAHLACGFTYLVTNSLQLDCSIDIGRDDGNTLFFVDFGMSAMLKD